MTRTADGHFALLPARLGVGGIAPESKARPARVATVVLRRFHAPVRVVGRLLVVARVRGVARPRLARSAANSRVLSAHVLGSEGGVSTSCRVCSTNPSISIIHGICMTAIAF